MSFNSFLMACKLCLLVAPSQRPVMSVSSGLSRMVQCTWPRYSLLFTYALWEYRDILPGKCGDGQWPINLNAFYWEVRPPHNPRAPVGNSRDCVPG